MFREDRLLLALTLAMSAAVVMPVLFTPFLPLIDLGSNVGAAGLIDDLLLGRMPISERYTINWYPIPYWTAYLVMAAFDVIGGAIFATKATVALVVVALPLAQMRFLYALGRSPRLGLWAFLLAWDVNMFWGWFTFQLGMALAIWALARLVEARTLREHARLIPLMAVVSLTHALAVALLGLAGALLVFAKAPIKRALLHHAVALSGLFALTPWILSRIFKGGGGGGGFVFEQATLGEKAISLYRFAFDVSLPPTGATLSVVAFLIVLLGPAILGALSGAIPSEFSGRAAVLFLISSLTLYLVLPFSMTAPMEHYWTYPRYATYVLLGLMLLPSVSLEGRAAWLLLPGLVVAVWLNVERAKHFARTAEMTRPYLEIISAMKPNTRFLPLDYRVDGFLGQLHGYMAAEKSAYDPHLFDHANSPVLFKPTGRPPEPDFRRVAETFSMEAQGKFYDYLITYPRSADQLLTSPDVTLVKEAGEWRLYEVKKR